MENEGTKTVTVMIDDYNAMVEAMLRVDLVADLIMHTDRDYIDVDVLAPIVGVRLADRK